MDGFYSTRYVQDRVAASEHSGQCTSTVSNYSCNPGLCQWVYWW
jgi:hypothetical protein